MVLTKRKYKLYLFKAGSEYNSETAEKNLRNFMNSNGIDDEALEIINIEERPKLALKHNVFLTPALLITSENKENIIFGNLSDSNKLQQVLRE